MHAQKQFHEDYIGAKPLDGFPFSNDNSDGYKVKLEELSFVLLDAGKCMIPNNKFLCNSVLC